MYQPKFNIGDSVSIKDYFINKATIIGISIYSDHNFRNVDNKSTIEYLDQISNCDYDVIFNTINNEGFIDCFSEQYLEEYKDGE